MGVTFHLRNVRLAPEAPTQDLSLRDGRLEEYRAAAGTDVEGAGALLLPGMIDPHVHLRSPGMEAAEDWESGTRAAARGGVTTLFEMPNTRPATTTRARLEEKRALARGTYVNWGLYLGATADNLAEIENAGNVAGLKVYLGSSTGDLLLHEEEALEPAFRAAARAGLPVAVHAEDEAMIRARAAALSGEEDVSVHNRVRPPAAAAEAIRRALALARRTGARLFCCHVSTAAELALLREAKQEGQDVVVEATPHHLFLQESDLERLGNFGKVNPPLRDASDRAALGEAVRTGTVDLIGTDHAPHPRAAKERPYREAPSGMPGLESALPLLLTATLRGEIGFERLLALTSGNAARLFGIENGGWVLADTETERALDPAQIVSRCGWNPFAGIPLRGWPLKVWVNGTLVFDDGAFSPPGCGREVAFRNRGR